MSSILAIMKHVSRALVALLLLFLPVPTVHGQRRASKPRLSAVGYYIALQARLYTDSYVGVSGASNLPVGSMIMIDVYDFIGTGGKRLNQDVTVKVRNDGLFDVQVNVRKGAVFKANMVCDAVFDPNSSQQPGTVTRIVGRRGERLGATGNNPQVQTNSRTTLLVARTVIIE